MSGQPSRTCQLLNLDIEVCLWRIYPRVFGWTCLSDLSHVMRLVSTPGGPNNALCLDFFSAGVQTSGYSLLETEFRSWLCLELFLEDHHSPLAERQKR